MTLTRPLTHPLTRSITRGLTQPGAGGAANNEATIVILLGQSLNAPRGTTIDATSWTAAQMFVGGDSINNMDFFASNVTWCADWNDVATSANYTEGAAQGIGVGVLSTLEAGPRPMAYCMSVAIGSRAFDVLDQGGPRAMLAAAVYRMCDLATAAGYTPKVVFYSAHGEADAFAGTTEAQYYSRGLDYYRMCQMYAALAMDDPTYVAPVYLTYPLQQANTVGNAGENDRAIKEAIRRIGQDLDGAVDMGAIYQWPAEADRIHPEENGYIFRGERLGRIIAGNPEPAPYITGVTLSGTTFVATFSEAIVRDTSLGAGTNLNAANQLDGLEWFDNGSNIKINSLVYGTTTVTGTLNSTPVGTLGQQVLRIAEQLTTSTLVAGITNISGSQVRAAGSGWASTYDPAYINYRWAIPQRITGVSAP